MTTAWTTSHALPLLAALAAIAATAARGAAQDDRTLLQGAFARFDGDGDGAIVRKEFPGSDGQFAAMDRDRDGKVTFAEFEPSAVAQAFLRARRREEKEPRPRTTADQLAVRRLELLSRCDRNRDGKVTRQEWNGTAQAFEELDLDRDGVLGRGDRVEAQGLAPPERVLPEPKGDLPMPEELLRRFDKDQDGELSKKELGGQAFLVAAFPFADADGNGGLSLRELQALQAELARRRDEQDRSGRRPEPNAVAFDAWDKDKDGAIRQDEWQGPRQLFERIDLDRDAAVSRDEVRRYELRVRGDDFVQRFDQNGDGKVTLAEFGGPAAAFRRADRTGDGAVSKADL